MKHIKDRDCYLTAKMMIKKTLYLAFMLVMLSCHHKKAAEPINASEILNKNQMTAILTDLYLTEAILANHVNENYNIKQYTTYHYNFLFKKHHTNRQQMLNSIHYYCFNTKEFSIIYNDVINKLSSMRTKNTEE